MKLIKLLALICSVSLYATKAEGQTLAFDGSPGLFGTPYAYLIGADLKMWENYRKLQDSHNPPYPPMYAVNISGSDQFRYIGERFGCSAFPSCSYLSAAMFLFRQKSLQTSSYARLYFKGASDVNGSKGIDVRLGFMQDGSSGNRISDFVNSRGGDNTPNMDFYPGGGLMTNAIYQYFQVRDSGGHWIFNNISSVLVAAASSSDEPHRANHVAETTFPGMTDQGNGVRDGNILSSTPLPLRWFISQNGDNIQFLIDFWGSQISWIFDDGVLRHGMTDPQNPDAIGYQGGSLNLSQLVPAIYIGDTFVSGDPAPSATLTLGLQTVTPELRGYPLRLAVGASGTFQIRFVDVAGNIIPDYRGKIHFSSTDPAANLPIDYLFTPSDNGVHVFQAAFGTAGLQSISAADPESNLSSTQSGIVVEMAPSPPERTDYRVKTGCSAVKESSKESLFLEVLGLIGVSLWRELKRSRC